ncbi:amino acid adenylation domain-containing protein [Streptomyces sp. NPDC059740]|uniref:amino acid adenylation domain-containing protein n=1 Tax=Streptomyces sp. NPDC059740 TaxID=3346926 RepID=UPI0036592870
MSELATVSGVVASVLGLDRVRPEDCFGELGGTSLQAVRVCARLRRELGVRVDPGLLQGSASTREFAASVAALRRDATRSGDLPAAGTVHAAVARQARLRPAAPALRHAATLVTYAELDAAADCWAAALQRRGVGPGTRVPVMLPRSPELVAVLLAVLKCGAAYAAVDHRWPAGRVRAVVAALAAPVQVTDGPGVGTAPVWSPGRGGVRAAAAAGGAPAPVAVTGTDPATVFFTSGTTGEPKGVLSPHRATLRLFGGRTFADFGPGRVMAQAAPVAWDAFSLELWGMLTTGGSCVISEGDVLFPQDLRRLVRETGVDTVWLTASLFNLFVDEDLACFTGLRQVMTGGERLSPTHVAAFLDHHPQVALVNGYGPVESCVFVSTRRVRRADCELPDGVPIGSAVPGTEVHLLDGEEVVAEGEAGEICVAGDGLALGYLGAPQATAEKFVTVPVSGTPTRLYRTGDLARRDDAGVLHFLGRADRQLKISGYRVEPSEIEAVAARLPGVRQCAVVPVRSAGGAVEQLALFYTSDGDGTDPETLRRQLAATLPHYMVPATVRHTASFPTTDHGKLDRAALLATPPPAPTRPEEGTTP